MTLWKCLSLFMVISALSVENVQSRIFDKCGLAWELLGQGFPHHELADWVCLVQHESSYNTQAMNYNNVDGSFDWGLFQINDMYWCNPWRPGFNPAGNGCEINCDELLSDDIWVAGRCAQHIKWSSHDGFGAWVAWRERCAGQYFDLSDCGIRGL